MCEPASDAALDESRRPRGAWAKLYVADILDLCSRKLVGLAMDTHMESDLVQRALHMALTERQPEAGLLHHSDQGSQYTSGEYFMLLDAHQAASV